MEQKRQVLVWGLLVALLAALVLVPGLGSYGFWEPSEMKIAANALERIEKPLPTESSSGQTQKAPRLSEALIESSMKSLDVTENASRLPFALVGVLIIVGVFVIGAHMGGGAVGLLASLICLGTPLLIFQSRQLQSDSVAVMGQLLGAAGIAGLFLNSRQRAQRWWPLVLSLLALALGIYILLRQGTLLAGLLPPLCAGALAGLMVLFDGSKDHSAFKLRRRIAIASVASFVALGVLLWLAKQDIQRFTREDIEGPVQASAILGGVWKTKSIASLTFNHLYESIAFGLGPWICVAPIALLMLINSSKDTRERWVVGFLVMWVAIGWAASSYLATRVGPQSFIAFPAVTLGLALWLHKGFRGDGIKLTPLIGIFALFAGVVLAKDISAFPEKFLGLHLDKMPKEFPEGFKNYRGVSLLTVALSACLALGFSRNSPGDPSSAWGGFGETLHKIARFAIPGAFLVSVIFSLYLSQVWPRQMDARLSSRQTFESLKAIRQPGERFALVGHRDLGATFYAGRDHERLLGRKELIEFLKAPERNYAVVQSSELCPLFKESRKSDLDFFVLDDSNPARMLISNRFYSGQGTLPDDLAKALRPIMDHNILSQAVYSELPDLTMTSHEVDYSGQVTLVGTVIPARVERGSEFEAKLIYKVVKPMSRDWKIFLHFDGAIRFQGDHDPLGGTCGTRTWVPGDFIVDTTKVKAGSIGSPKGTYTIFTGFFSGSGGSWSNLGTDHKDSDDKDRVKIGTLTLY